MKKEMELILKGRDRVWLAVGWVCVCVLGSEFYFYFSGFGLGEKKSFLIIFFHIADVENCESLKKKLNNGQRLQFYSIYKLLILSLPQQITVTVFAFWIFHNHCCLFFLEFLAKWFICLEVSHINAKLRFLDKFFLLDKRVFYFSHCFFVKRYTEIPLPLPFIISWICG